MPIVSLTRQTLQTEPLQQSLQSSRWGGYVIFAGDVRAGNAGKDVVAIEYEAYESLAEKELLRIATHAEEQWLGQCAIVHRLGRVASGETSVVVVYAAVHRAEAFDACRWAIDSLKSAVPIWKREIYADGEDWIEGPDRVPRS